MAVVSDPIADMLTRVRNAVRAKQDSVRMPASKMKIALAKISARRRLHQIFQGRARGQRQAQPQGRDKKDAKPLSHNLLIVYLKYGPGGESILTGLRRMSRPGLRRYVASDRIPRIIGGLGITIISTSRGVMTGREARKQGLGGEVICSIW